MKFVKDKLTVRIYDTREEIERAAAKDIGYGIREELGKKREVTIVFAAALPRYQMLYDLIRQEKIAWKRVRIIHTAEEGQHLEQGTVDIVCMEIEDKYLIDAERYFCIALNAAQAELADCAVFGEISDGCQASILRQKENAVLYCDRDSSSIVRERIRLATDAD